MSEPTSPALVAGDPVTPVPPVPPGRAALPWRGFLLDALVAGVLLMGLSALLITPIVFMHMMSDGTAATGGEPDLSAVMPEITAAAIFAMLLTAVLTWWLRGRAVPGRLPAMAAAPAFALAIVGGLLVQAGTQGVAWLLAQSGAAPEPSNAAPVMALLQSTPWSAWLLIVLVGPFAEELLLRHVLLRRFALAGHAFAGVLLTSLTFALMHEPMPTQAGVAAWLGGLAMYTGMGVGFALVYLRTGRLLAAFAAHAACNAAALLLAAYSVS
jgi:membrane protease YdiL (CAAX protease family)